VNVESRTVTKRDGTSFTIYDVSFSNDQVFGTTKRQLAERAFELIGVPAEVLFSVKQNGDFTNYYLNEISQASSRNALQAVQSAQEAQPESRTGSDIPRSSQGLTEKDRQIHRQTAAKVAAVLHQATPGSATDFWENCRKLSEYFDTGDFPSWGVDEPEDDIPF
jgi:hypothetical protein